MFELSAQWLTMWVSKEVFDRRARATRKCPTSREEKRPDGAAREARVNVLVGEA